MKHLAVVLNHACTLGNHVAHVSAFRINYIVHEAVFLNYLPRSFPHMTKSWFPDLLLVFGGLWVVTWGLLVLSWRFPCGRDGLGRSGCGVVVMLCDAV